MPDFKAIQDKWQKAWEENQVFKVKEDKHKKKFYCLEMFPYPSASFLHMGHVRNYSIGDAIARFKRLNGHNVLYPMGYDSFGLPAENAAKKQKIHPREYTEDSIKKITEYMKKLGLSYDWSRMIATHRPEYYKWNQYFFIKFYEKGLVYRKKAPVNFCLNCNTVLANEEVEQGKCWRCDNEVVQKELDQWFFKTTAYTEELLNDIKNLGWSDKIKTIQENWIGKSHGLMVNFKLDDGEDFPIYTTRPDTIYGVTFMVIALSHPKLMKLVQDPYKKAVTDFMKEVKYAEAKEDASFLEKNGVFTGRYVINPLNNERVPLYAGNFVVADYATGAIMAVPAHDQRDFEFAKKYDIPVKEVIVNQKSNCIIIHGSPDDERHSQPNYIPEDKKPWYLWIKKELENVGIQTIIPLMPNPTKSKINYDAWKEELEKLKIDENSILIGHSAGGAFLVRYLSEHPQKIKKLILVAAAKIPKDSDKNIAKFYDFKINPELREYISEKIIFVSNDDQRHQDAAQIYTKELDGLLIKLENKKHFRFSQMGTDKFPELLDKILEMNSAYTGDGVLVNSDSFNGLSNDDAIDKISGYVEKHGLGKKTINYKLKDWLISRQRYWGTPIPMIFCDKCGIVPVPENSLPLLLPDDVEFNDKGNPLLTSKTFIETKCPKCNGNARRETDTMGGFMDSSWYFLRYCSPETEDKPFDKDAVKYWMPVDQYVGGIEHAVGHLIYSRFFVKALRDMKMLDIDEPFNALFNQGIVYKDGAKMSKSHGNIVTQDEIAGKYGIDTARTFVLFVASPEKEMEWNDKGIEGTFKFINRTFKLYEELESFNSVSSRKDKYLISKKNIVIKNLTNTISDFKLNAAILSLMDFVNYLYDVREYVSKEVFTQTLSELAIMINPFMPHVSEECWHMLGNDSYSSKASWPEYNDELIDEKLHYLEELLDNTKKDIYSVLQLAKIEKPENITIIISPEWKYKLYSIVKDKLIITRNTADIIKHVMSSDLKKHGQDIMKIVPKLIDKMPEHILEQESENTFFSENKEFLEKEFNCIVDIILSEDSQEQKAKNASPGKPAIIVK